MTDGSFDKPGKPPLEPDGFPPLPFPLKLTLWEEFFLVDDYRNYPANFMVRIRCRGQLPERILQDALRQSIQRHPLFGCRIVIRRNQAYWIKDDSPELPVVYHSVQRVPEPRPLKPFQPTLERLWRVDVFEQPEDVEGDFRSDIHVEIHHSLCDGLGAIQFISDVARTIHVLSGRENGSHSGDVQLARTDPGLLPDRGRIPISWREFFRAIPYHAWSLTAAVRLAFTRIDSLVRIESVPELLDRPHARLGYRKLKLSETESAGLRRCARKNRTTVNSIMLTLLFQTMELWRRSNGDPVSTLRIMVPFNERTLRDQGLPACNRVSLSPFTRTQTEIRNPQRLLSSLDHSVRVLKKTRLGLNFHRGLRFCKTVFGSLQRLANTNRVGATCLFANVGNLNTVLGLPHRHGQVLCGPIIIEDVDLIPPLRPGTSFGMTFHEFDGCSRLAVHYDTNAIPDRCIGDFLALLHDRIRRLLAAGELLSAD